MGEYIGIGHPDSDIKDAVVWPGELYRRMQFARQKVILSWIYDIVTYWRILKLLERGKVDLKPLITHRIPLSDAPRGFEMGLKQECVKAMLFP
jgi:threonine dehydrogenase-like Zn-dependent dehydrogenase